MNKINTFGIATKAIVYFDNKLLIIQRQSNDDYTAGEFDLPGGRLEFGEMPEAGLKREVKEEVGLDIEIIAPTRTWSFIKQDIQLVGITYFTQTNNNKIVLSHEHQNYLWLKESELEAYNLPSWLIEELKIGFLYASKFLN